MIEKNNSLVLKPRRRHGHHKMKMTLKMNSNIVNDDEFGVSRLLLMMVLGGDGGDDDDDDDNDDDVDNNCFSHQSKHESNTKRQVQK